MRFLPRVLAAAALLMFDARSPRVTKLTGGGFEVSSFTPKYVQRGTLRRERPGHTPEPKRPRADTRGEKSI